MLRVKYLSLKRAEGSTVTLADALHLTPEGIRGNAKTLNLRHVLFMDESTLQKFVLRPGELKENVVVDDFAGDGIFPGDKVEIGNTVIRITIPCEVCGKIKDKVDLKEINKNYQRGLLGQVILGGQIEVGDPIRVTKNYFESIPIDFGDRIKWFLEKREQPIELAKLVRGIGFRTSYCRTVPRLLERRPDIDRKKIIIQSRLS